jgi:hypothetical protein
MPSSSSRFSLSFSRTVLLEPRREARERAVAWLNEFLTALKGP